MQRCLFFSFTFASALACGEADVIEPTPSAAPRPHVVALSTYEASLGTLIEVYGTHLPGVDVGQTLLVFDGVYETRDGQTSAVRIESPVRRVDQGTARWTGFGPYHNPFHSSGRAVGTFHGTVGARVITASGEVLDDESPTPIRFVVAPSILIHEFQPLTASCNGAALRVLAGASYRLSVEAIGFEPASFTYTIAAPSLRAAPTAIRHVANGRFDAVGLRGDFTMPPVPENMQAYGAIVSVQAQTEDGKIVQSVFGLTAHRPLEVYYNGNVEIGEIMAPTPVSGCIPGGEIGRNVSYSESQTEERSRNYQVNWNESWLSSHTVSSGSESTIGLSETNGVGFATTDGQTFKWSLGTSVEGTFGLDKLVSIGVGVKSEVGGDRSRTVENSASRESGVNASSTTTETEELSESRGQELGEAFSWNVSSSETLSRGFDGFVLPRTYAVFYRQTMRLVRRAAVVAYNQCGFASVVAEVDFTDWTWSPDLALADSCPPLPPSNLPPAECMVPPCAGQ